MPTFKTTVMIPVEVVVTAQNENEARKAVAHAITNRCQLYLDSQSMRGAVMSIRLISRQLVHGQYVQTYPAVEMSTMLGARDDLGREVCDG